MARIPKKISRTPPSGRVAGVQTPFDIADTGAGIEAQGLGALGGGITNLAQALSQIQAAEGTSQAATARSQANAEIQALELNLKNNNDPSTYQAEYDKTFDSMERFRPKNPVGSKQFDDFLSQSSPGWEVGVTGLRLRKTKDLAEGAYISNKSSAIAMGNLEEIESIVQGAVDTGVITSKQAANDLAAAPTQIIEFSINTTLNNASQLTSEGDLKNAEIEIAKAETILNDPDAKIDPAKEKTLRSAVNTNKSKIKVAKTVQQQNNADDFLLQISQGSDTATTLAALEASLAADNITGADFKSLKSDALSVVTVDDPAALERVNSALSKVGDDTLSLAEGKKILRENSALLKNETVNGLTGDLNKEFNASTDTAYSRTRTDIRSRAIGRSESLIDRLVELLTGSEQKDQKKIEDRITTAREKFNFELDNFNKWEEVLRAWRRDNSDATPEQISKEGIRSWRTDFSGKDIEQLRSEFDFVKIRTPDGRVGVVPRGQLEAAKRALKVVEVK